MFQGYGNGAMAPGIVGMGTTAYLAAHNQIRAHGRAYRYMKYFISLGASFSIISIYS